MDTFVSAPGGWELVLMAVVPGTILGLLLLVYVVVRLASHDRRTPPVADETTSD